MITKFHAIVSIIFAENWFLGISHPGGRQEVFSHCKPNPLSFHVSKLYKWEAKGEWIKSGGGSITFSVNTQPE